MKRHWLFVTVLLAQPVQANHPWGELDLCTARRDSVPPGIDATLLPQPAAPGAVLLQRFCTQCHNLPGPGRHTKEEWPAVLERMRPLMQLSRFYRGPLGPVAMPDSAQWEALRAYLQRHALQALPPPDPRHTSPAEQGYRTLCGDCHRPPDPRAYATANWPALHQRMRQHRSVMARPPLTPAQQAAIALFIGVTLHGTPISGEEPITRAALHATPGAAGTTPGEGRDEPSTLARSAILTLFFGLALLGLWRGWLAHQRAKGPSRDPIKQGRGH